MKTQNTPENKAKFFALYWGQKVLVLDGLASNVDSWIDGNNIKSFTLKLKPLSAISDEDAIEVARIAGYNIIRSNIVELGKSIVMDICSGIGGGSIRWNESLSITDFLRSKGYLLGWMDLTTEDILAYGWVRLEEQG